MDGNLEYRNKIILKGCLYKMDVLDLKKCFIDVYSIEWKICSFITIY